MVAVARSGGVGEPPLPPWRKRTAEHLDDAPDVLEIEFRSFPCTR